MTEVNVSVKTTINLGDFENVVIEIGLVGVEVQPGEKTVEAVDRAYALVAGKVAEKAAKFKGVS